MWVEKEFCDVVCKNWCVFVCVSMYYLYLCNIDYIKLGWGVGVGRMERGCCIKKLEIVKLFLCILLKRMGDMKIKIGVGIFVLFVFMMMMIFVLVFVKIEEGKLVIWINGDKGYNGLVEVGKKFE